MKSVTNNEGHPAGGTPAPQWPPTRPGMRNIERSHESGRYLTPDEQAGSLLHNAATNTLLGDGCGGGLPACPSDTYRHRECHHAVRELSIHPHPTLKCDAFARRCDGCPWRSLRFNPAMVRWICVDLRYLWSLRALPRPRSVSPSNSTNNEGSQPVRNASPSFQGPWEVGVSLDRIARSTNTVPSPRARVRIPTPIGPLGPNQSAVIAYWREIHEKLV